MKTVACRMDLGVTRIAGYILYDPNSHEFHETTPRDVENLVKRGQLNGLAFNEQGALIPDVANWNMGNLKIKSAVGRYRDYNTEQPKGDTVYSVVRAIKVTDDEVIQASAGTEGTGGSGVEAAAGGVGTEPVGGVNLEVEPIYLYEVINNRCGRQFYTKGQILALAQFAWVGGIKVDLDTNTIQLCKGVQEETLVSIHNQDAYELGTKVVTKDTLMSELFNGDHQSEPHNNDMSSIFNSMEGFGSQGVEAGPAEQDVTEGQGDQAGTAGMEPQGSFPEGAEGVTDGAANDSIIPSNPAVADLAGASDTPIPADTPIPESGTLPPDSETSLTTEGEQQEGQGEVGGETLEGEASVEGVEPPVAVEGEASIEAAGEGKQPETSVEEAVEGEQTEGEVKQGEAVPPQAEGMDGVEGLPEGALPQTEGEQPDTSNKSSKSSKRSRKKH